MRWTTYKAQIKALRSKNPARAKEATYGKWHWYFAWRTVSISRYCYARWEWVQRRGFFSKDHNWCWEYRYAPKAERE